MCCVSFEPKMHRVGDSIGYLCTVSSPHNIGSKFQFIVLLLPFQWNSVGSGGGGGEEGGNDPAHIMLCAILTCPCVSPTYTGNK